MNKQLVRWKEFKGKNFFDTETAIPIAEQLDLQYRGTLLFRILTMEQKMPLNFEDAMCITNEALRKAFNEEKMGAEFGHFHWYLDNFIAWISSQGYHIELTGDEFEPYVLSERLL